MQTNASHMPPSRATRREWVGLSVMALPCLLYSMDLNVLNLAATHIAADLRPSATQLLWIVDIYGFLLAGFLITMGSLGDRIGRRRLLLLGAGAFGGASLLAAFSRSAEMLIVSRALLGVAAATLAPSTLSLIRNMFLDPRERTLAISIWTSCFAAGGILGPVVGGVLLQYYWWGSVFLIAVPVMALVLAVVPRILPEFRSRDAAKLDVMSSALVTSAVLAMIYGMKRIAAHGFDVAGALALCAGVMIALLFAQRQHLLPNPMLDLSLFRSPLFSAALGINVVAVFAMSGSFLLIAQYLQLVSGMSSLEAGLWIAPSGLVFIAGSMLAPLIVRHCAARTVLATGFMVTALGYAILAQARPTGEPEIVFAGLMLFCAGFAPMVILTMDLVMAAVPPDKAGAASGISETSLEFGAALGIAVLGSIMIAVYRTRMTHAMLDGVPASAVASARDTLGAAVVAAQALHDQRGTVLLQAAREAFTVSFQATSVCNALFATAAALVCLKFVRPPGSRSIRVAGTEG